MKSVDLYPPIEPYRSGYLPVDSLHTLYWEECGSPTGVPIVFLHGGPGAGASPTHRRFFDPARFRIIIFDQRGSGRSTPLGEVRDNDLPHLTADLEMLRLHLGVERWHVFGGSWGSTLGIAYAEAYPDPVLSLTLRGIFLMTGPEIDWFFHGVRSMAPAAHANFVNFIPEDERGDLLEAYWRRLDSEDDHVRLAAARTWSMYEGSCSTLLPNAELMSTFGEARHAVGLARLEAHYFRRNRLDPDDALLRGVERIRHIPATIIQGRYDLVCPIVTADALHRAWPEAKYVIVHDAGHSAMEPTLRAALVAATDALVA
ncbi:prolyl aminopeptidase [Roseiterribacter gracilis]|uniref:Proline iminopeptidase n=1 Tax=Roseiterribacter gracilis TaxID=2812848 RepID=A0A8S8XC81_9PROT|nr:proline iminopeptidase [Rhodospirillales bacterium TMPK1]